MLHVFPARPSLNPALVSDHAIPASLPRTRIYTLSSQVLAFVAPKIIGGARAPTPVGELGNVEMTQVWVLNIYAVLCCAMVLGWLVDLQTAGCISHLPLFFHASITTCCLLHTLCSTSVCRP